jgi:hypothetical protein
MSDIADLGRKLIGTLPPAFIMLLLINCGFLGMVLWFLDAQLERRTALLNRIFDFCLTQQPGLQ